MALQLGRVTQKLCKAANTYCRVFAAEYAKKIGGGKMGVQAVKKPTLEVETDVAKLTQFCCGANIYSTGEDPKLKPDEEYPEWLWSLRLDHKPPQLSEMDPEDFKYWRRLRKMTLRQNNKLMKVAKLRKK
ncbi:large ribosomal subunit protein mL54-like [Babylonia areolata]|uniref:large ribosomal subunit protein mL54-like n=1 Tax=Babylonia areolata TaxID=304850 RepID=UPI003FD69E88